MVALDCATPETTAYFHQTALDHWPKQPFEEGDLGRVRNAIVPQAQGRFIAFLDADDLFSENWLREGVLRLRAAEAQGKRAIAHPELNWLFDGAQSVFLKPDQADPLFTPYHFYFMNYYDSLCMCPRAAHLEHPYVHRDIPAGLSFQDWQFSIETMAAGWEHMSARDTIIFKRRRDDSLVTESRSRRALVRQLAPMAIDQVAGLGQIQKPRKDAYQSLEKAVSTSISPSTDMIASDAPPFWGKAFEARVARARAKRGQVSEKHKDAYKAIAAHFDHAYYLSCNDDICQNEDIDPVAHYIRAGWREGRDPAPDFSNGTYLEDNPELSQTGTNPFFHWLTAGKKAGQTVQPVKGFNTVAKAIGLKPAKALKLWRTRLDDLKARLARGALGDQVQRAAQHEPLIEITWPAAMSVKIPPFHSDKITERTAAIYRLFDAAGHKPAKHVICVNTARFGGARRMEGHVARLLASRDGAENVLIVLTDKSAPVPENKFPENVRVIDFAALVPDIKGDPRQRILAEFLRALRAETATNINSRLMWDMLTPYGTALTASIQLYACLFCNERTPLGYWTGYPLRRVYRHFTQLSGLFTDSHALRDELCQRYRFSPSQLARLHVMPGPVNGDIPVVTHKPKPRPQLFWAGRFDPQKRVDLVYEIARACPEIDIRMWGAPIRPDASSLPPRPDNVIHEGLYAHFHELPLEEADMWLYTAAWDGVPSILLEVAMTGLPLVGSDVGGTGEVLDPGLSHALGPDAAVAEWAKAIRHVLADQDGARENAGALRAALLERRGPSALQAAFEAIYAPEPPQ